MTVEGIGKHGANVCLAKTNHIRNEYAVVRVKLLPGLHHGIDLILKAHIAIRKKCLKVFFIRVDFFFEELIKCFHVELIGCNVTAHPGMLFDGFNIGIPDVRAFHPQCFKTLKGKLYICRVFQFYIEFQVVTQAGLCKVARSGDHAAKGVKNLFRIFSHDINF